MIPIALGLARLRLDVEVLNLLPEQSDAVRSLRTLNSEFTQARELTFALHGEREVVALGEALSQVHDSLLGH